MKKYLFTVAIGALIFVGYSSSNAIPAHAQAEAASVSPPCTAIPAASFVNTFKEGSGIDIIDLGDVVREPRYNNNVCSILIDTSLGRIRFYFTADRSVGSGHLIWRQVAIEEVPAGTPIARTPPMPTYTPPPAVTIAPPPAPAPTPVVVAPSAPPPAPAAAPIDPDFAAFTKGKQQRIGWENFIGSIVGDEHDGAVWWSGQRSLKNPGSCGSGPSDTFRKGCEEAQAILGPSDVQRRINPAYRAGWNSL